MAFTNDQQRRYDCYYAMLNAHGYWISAEPIEGMEDVFLADIKQACAKIEETAAFLRRRYRYRGLSNNLIRELAISLPCPSFNVSNYVAAEIMAEENRRRA